MVAGEVAAVVHDRDAPLRVDHEAHAVGAVLADDDLRRAAREQVLLGDELLAVRQLARARAPSARSFERSCALVHAPPAGRTGMTA